MVTAQNMSHVAVVLDVVAYLQSQGRLTLLRIKERFLTQPSGGGT